MEVIDDDNDNESELDLDIKLGFLGRIESGEF